MTHLKRTMLWLLTIFFVGVAALDPDSAEEIIRDAVEATAGRGTAPDADDFDADRDVSSRAAPNKRLPRRAPEERHDLAARRGQFTRSAQAQTRAESVLSQILPSATPRLISLRL